MALGDADGVGSTLHLVAGVHTRPPSVDGEADLVVITVLVVTAARGLTAFSNVISVTLIAGETVTRAVITDSVGATDNIGAGRDATAGGVLQARLSGRL